MSDAAMPPKTSPRASPGATARPALIRPVMASDQPAWRDLYQQYAAFYRVPMTQIMLTETWAWLMRAQPPLSGLVAVLPTGELTGLAHYRACPEPLLGRDIGFLDDLFVAPAHRRQGVAGALIDAVAQVAQMRGWPMLRWVTAQDNATAQRLYDRLARATTWVTYEKPIVTT